MRPTPAESLFCGSSASVFDGLRDVSVAEVLDQADADQGHDEQAGDYRNQRGVAVGLIGAWATTNEANWLPDRPANAQALSVRPCVVETVLVPKC